MDVNTITNNVNSINKYDNPNTSQSNVTTDDIQASAILKDKEDQKKESSTSNSDVEGKKLNEVITKLNKLLEGDPTHAEYSVHKELGTTMIKIIDDDTKKVILEVPSEKILDMVASMCEQAGLIDKKA